LVAVIASFAVDYFVFFCFDQDDPILQQYPYILSAFPPAVSVLL